MLIALTLSAYAAHVDEIGGSQYYLNEGDMLKLVAIDAAVPAGITTLDFAVYNAHSSGDIVFVLYGSRTDGSTGYDLLDQVPAVSVPDEGAGWASSGPVAWLLEPGRTYAVGVWIASDWWYYYTDDYSANPWFGEVTASYQVQENDPIPDTITPDAQAHFYDMRITSDNPDADGDGEYAATWGGGDCDDNDATVGAATDEIPYDGIDQDCDGADLTDADGDGYASTVVGGDDCNDTTAAASPANIEICDDGIDNDCVGGDSLCADDGPILGSDDTLDISAGGCGCATGGGELGAGWLVGLGLLAARRRR